MVNSNKLMVKWFYLVKLYKNNKKTPDFLSSYDVDRLKNRKKNCANEWLRELSKALKQNRH